MFVSVVFSLCGVVYTFYPDKPAVPRRFPHNGLEQALGGKGAVPVRLRSEDFIWDERSSTNNQTGSLRRSLNLCPP